MDVGAVVGRRPVGLSDSDDRRNSEEGSSPVDIVIVPELIEQSDVGGSLIRLLLVSRWKILGNPGIGRMVGRAMQTTEMSHLTLGPGGTGPAAGYWGGDRSWSRWLGSSLVPDQGLMELRLNL